MDVVVEQGLRDLLLRANSGDAAAYHRFLAQTAGLVRAYLRRRLSSLPDEVEDLVQETLLAVHNQRHTYDPSQPLGPWVYALARYKLIDLLRRRSRRDLLHEPFDEEGDERLASDDAAGEARRDILRLLDELPDRHRLPILRVKIEGLSVAEAALQTGMSVSAVKVGIHRGLKALAARIGGSS